MNKTIAVIGGGNGAHTMAADLVLRGFSVRMYERPEYMDRLTDLARTLSIHIDGVIKGTARIDMLTDNMAEAIDGVDYIAVAVPSFAHEYIAESMKGAVKKDQIVILYPGAFGSLVFKKILGDNCPVMAETNNLPYDTRIKGPCKVFCSGINPINISFFPANCAEKYSDDVRKIIPFENVYMDVLECGLSIVNPVLHSGACLINIGMIEQPSRGVFHMYEHFTPGAAKIDLALDLERKEIGKAFGYKLRPIEDFMGKPKGYQVTWKDIYMHLRGDVALTVISGPHSIWDRYLTEDCPNGLAPWTELGDLCGVDTPVMDAVINIYSLVHERDWRAVGRSLDKLGIENMTIEEIKRYVAEGKK